MFRVLIYKEIRESLVVLILGGLVLLSIAAGFAGLAPTPFATSVRGIAFVYPSFTFPFICVAGTLAIALGLKQAAWEFDRNSSLFLLHRPVARERLIATKMITGGGLFFAASSLPILLLALWACVPGNQPAPFYWSMTAEAWRAMLSLSIVYLGAFLSGMRPAKWYGTRLLPVLGTIALALLIQVLPAWWVLGLVAVLAIDLILAEVILESANSRDYA